MAQCGRAVCACSPQHNHPPDETRAIQRPSPRQPWPVFLCRWTTNEHPHPGQGATGPRFSHQGQQRSRALCGVAAYGQQPWLVGPANAPMRAQANGAFQQAPIRRQAGLFVHIPIKKHHQVRTVRQSRRLGTVGFKRTGNHRMRQGVSRPQYRRDSIHSTVTKTPRKPPHRRPNRVGTFCRNAPEKHTNTAPPPMAF